MSLCIVEPCLNIDPCTLQANYTSVHFTMLAGRSPPSAQVTQRNTMMAHVIEDWCPLTACLEAITNQTFAQGKEAAAVIWLWNFSHWVLCPKTSSLTGGTVLRENRALQLWNLAHQCGIVGTWFEVVNLCFAMTWSHSCPLLSTLWQFPWQTMSKPHRSWSSFRACCQRGRES